MGFSNKGMVLVKENSYIDCIKGKMNRITPRAPIHKNTHQLIGRVLNNNCFPTMRGKMIYIQGDRCYFEMIKNNQVIGVSLKKIYGIGRISKKNFIEHLSN